MVEDFGFRPAVCVCVPLINCMHDCGLHELLLLSVHPKVSPMAPRECSDALHRVSTGPSLKQSVIKQLKFKVVSARATGRIVLQPAKWSCDPVFAGSQKALGCTWNPTRPMFWGV